MPVFWCETFVHVPIAKYMPAPGIRAVISKEKDTHSLIIVGHAALFCLPPGQNQRTLPWLWLINVCVVEPLAEAVRSLDF